MLESEFQSELIRDLKKMFPGCKVIKNDTQYLQGFPDLTVLYKKRWALLECKRSESEPKQPNQEYYIKWAKTNSFGAFIFPENKEEVLDALYHTFRIKRQTRILRS